MDEISTFLTSAGKYLRKVDEAIACPTISEKNHKAAKDAIRQARYMLDQSLSWLDANPPKKWTPDD